MCGPTGLKEARTAEPGGLCDRQELPTGPCQQLSGRQAGHRLPLSMSLEVIKWASKVVVKIKGGRAAGFSFDLP